MKKGNEHKVMKLRKALYGLKQAPIAWTNRIYTFLLGLGFVKCPVEYGVYVKIVQLNQLIIICLYMDDLLIIGSNTTYIENIKQNLKMEFEMTDLGTLSYVIGLEFSYTEKSIIMHQKQYVLEVLSIFNIFDYNYAETPTKTKLNLTTRDGEKPIDATMFRQMVGNWRIICQSMPKIAYSVGLISRFMKDPK